MLQDLAGFMPVVAVAVVVVALLANGCRATSARTTSVLQLLFIRLLPRG